MRLTGVEVTEGESPDRLRVQGTLRFDSDGREDLLWFDLPGSLAAQVSTSGNPWLVALLPLAVSLREPLRLELPVDHLLLDNCHSVMAVWQSWRRDRQPVAIEAPTGSGEVPSGPRGTGLFFSGGVDSFYSLIHQDRTDDGAGAGVTDLLLVHGADIPVSDAEAFARLRPRIGEVARTFGVGLVDIATNLRDTRWARADWAHLAHGALLAACGLLLEPRLSRVVISSSAPFARLRPYGSHPKTDPLYSTTATRVVHHGADADRPDKVQAIASHPAVLRHLRVCWIGQTDTNCGRCPKCLHTMVGLELSGTLSRAECLPTTIDPARFEGLYLDSRGTYNAYDMLKRYRPIAMERGRTDLVRLIDRVTAQSDRKRLVKDGIEALAKLRLISSDTRERLLARLFARSVKY